MKVAMVTPYYQESLEVLRRCHDSVLAQTHADVRHILVADGHPNAALDSWNCEHIPLPFSHRDAGGTPRAIGALSAFGRGYDAVGFIDADNSIDPEHAQRMIGVAATHRAQFVAATRRIHCGIDGRELYTDFIESNTEYMLDTNCMFLTRDCAYLLGYWITPSDQVLVNDRTFWQAVKSSGLRIARCLTPTVTYNTKWAFHYGYAGVEIPPDSVWFRWGDAGEARRDKDGLMRHGDLTEEEKVITLRNAIANLGLST